MIYVTSKAKKRISKQLKRFQKIIQDKINEDVNESDTGMVVADMLSDFFGYDKYSEISTETAIRGTYCDFGISLKDKLKLLIELKAAGIELKDYHVKQAIDYAANIGVDWVILTNGSIWQIYKVSFTKPINKELVFEINMLNVNPHNEKDLEMLFSICKEGLKRSVLDDLYNQSLATNKYILGNLLFGDDVINSLRREIKRNFPKISVQNDEIKNALFNNVIKREIFEGEEAQFSGKKIKSKVKIK